MKKSLALLALTACGSLSQTASPPPIAGTYINTQWVPQVPLGSCPTAPLDSVINIVQQGNYFTANGNDVYQQGYALQWFTSTTCSGGGTSYSVTVTDDGLAGGYKGCGCNASVLYSRQK